MPLLYLAAAALALSTGYLVLACGSSSRAERIGRIAQLVLLATIVTLACYHGLSLYEHDLAVAARV